MRRKVVNRLVNFAPGVEPNPFDTTEGNQERRNSRGEDAWQKGSYPKEYAKPMHNTQKERTRFS